VIFTSVRDIRDTALFAGSEFRSASSWRDEAQLPELVIDQVQAATIMPVLRAFWLLFGEHRPDGMEIGAE
jgi:hypothetical protein